jgi:hypothetical protein
MLVEEGQSEDAGNMDYCGCSGFFSCTLQGFVRAEVELRRD